jgi:hypothetical protein
VTNRGAVQPGIPLPRTLENFGRSLIVIQIDVLISVEVDALTVSRDRAAPRVETPNESRQIRQIDVAGVCRISATQRRSASRNTCVAGPTTHSRAPAHTACTRAFAACTPDVRARSTVRGMGIRDHQDKPLPISRALLRP